MAVLAKEFGWHPDFIMWDISLAQANAYLHACLRLNKVDTRRITDHEESLASKFDDVFR